MENYLLTYNVGNRNKIEYSHRSEKYFFFYHENPLIANDWSLLYLRV